MEVNYIDWRIHPFRADQWYEIWRPAAARAMSFGAKGWSLSRSTDDRLLFRQTSLWERREDFERYWFSDEISALREQALNYYNKPVAQTWHLQLAGE